MKNKIMNKMNNKQNQKKNNNNKVIIKIKLMTLMKNLLLINKKHLMKFQKNN